MHSSSLSSPKRPQVNFIRADFIKYDFDSQELSSRSSTLLYHYSSLRYLFFATSRYALIECTKVGIAEVVEEWSILFTCFDYEYGAQDREPVIEKMQELRFHDVEEERAAVKSLLTKVELPATPQISAIPQNATLALTQTFYPQIFQIPLSTCLLSTSQPHSISSLVRIVTLPTCPPELPKLSTLIYTKPGCLELRRYQYTKHSYPLYKSLFENFSGFNLGVKGWPLGFVCLPANSTDLNILRGWKIETEMELIFEGKGMDPDVKVVRAGIGEGGKERLIQGVQIESQMKVEAAQRLLRDV
ncbi:hypothetical protein BOTCAL_0046g00410 [Botryotinia calthae]|uniref:Uncharacterized protein n=1 Tax=Botryotinia calthae TaxID=38488 RepID=A0A4Y8DBN9_9HELO|nr:hypothetical protein BOTCAL_0046g00410 [Botryotinia calthae]